MKFSVAALSAIFVCITHEERVEALVSPTQTFVKASLFGSARYCPKNNKLEYFTQRKRVLASLAENASRDYLRNLELNSVSTAESETPTFPELGKDGLYKIMNKEQHLNFLEANPDKIVVLKFFAPWCRACKGLEPKFLRVKNDDRYDNLPLVFADFNVQDNKEYIKALGILALPNVHIYAGADGLVENFPCGPSKVPILKKKIAQVVNERVDEETFQLVVRDQLEVDCEEDNIRETEPCRERDIVTSVGDTLISPERVLSLRNIPFFADFTEVEYNTLMSKAKLNTYEPGSVIMKQGKKGRHFYVIDSGEVEISIKSSYEDPLHTPSSYLGAAVNVLSKDDYFGERALITGEPRAASIRAVEKTRCFAFDKDDIPASSVLSGTKSATQERLDQVNDKYGLDTLDIYDIGIDKQLTNSKIASQERGSVYNKNDQIIVENDEEDYSGVSDLPSKLVDNLQYSLPKKDILTILMRFKHIRRAAKCFEYISRTQPRFGDVGEQRRRSMLVSMLTPSQISDFMAAFEVIDKSHDNIVSLQEMRAFMDSVGSDKTDEELLDMMNKANPMVDGNTEMTFDEFMGVMAEAEFYSLFYDTFTSLDKRNSGFVRAGDIDRVLDGMRDLISDDRKSLIDVDDKDMLVNYEQFSKMLLGIP